MRIMLFGGTGFVGHHLQSYLKARGYLVRIYDVRRDSTYKSELQNTDAVINLAGAPLVGQRWNSDVKRKLLESRIQSTKSILDSLRSLHEAQKAKPRILIQASAVGYYGDRGEESLSELSTPGRDFLAELCQQWETEALKAKHELGMRTVILRMGMVLGDDGGALPKLLRPFQAFVGGPIASGKHWMSWIHIEDLCALVDHALNSETMEGPVNAVAPHPVQNKNFAKTVGRILGRPYFIPVPTWALRIVLGEAAAVLTASQKVQATQAVSDGFRFRYAQLKPALENLLQEHY